MQEMEAVIIVDVLRRANVAVDVASVETGLQVEASRGVKLVADKLISECTYGYDVIALPVCGAPNTFRLSRQCLLLLPWFLGYHAERIAHSCSMRVYFGHSFRHAFDRNDGQGITMGGLGAGWHAWCREAER
jgi:DJ-1/PfpI family